jgi:hypothetical protein
MPPTHARINQETQCVAGLEIVKPAAHQLSFFDPYCNPPEGLAEDGTSDPRRIYSAKVAREASSGKIRVLGHSPRPATQRGTSVGANGSVVSLPPGDRIAPGQTKGAGQLASRNHTIAPNMERSQTAYDLARSEPRAGPASFATDSPLDDVDRPNSSPALPPGAIRRRMHNRVYTLFKKTGGA